MPLLNIWGYFFKEHPLTSYDTIAKIKVLLFFFMGQAATGLSLLQRETSGVVAPTRPVFTQKEKRLKTIQEKFSNKK